MNPMPRHVRFLFFSLALVAAGCQRPAEAPSAAAPARAQAAQRPVAQAAGKGGTTRAAGQDISPVVRLSSIGATKAFLERVLGQSAYETPDEARYTVGACDVTLGLDERAAVTSVSIELKPGCAFDASWIAGSERAVRIDGPLTFAAFERLFGPARYSSPCLHDCGNAYDSFVDAAVPGSRANGFVDISAHAIFAAGPTLDAANLWREQLIARAGEAYVDRTRFNCDATYEAIPRAAFRAVEVDSIEFGRDLGSDCRQP